MSLVPFMLQYLIGVLAVIGFNFLNQLYFHIDAPTTFTINVIAATAMLHIFFFRMYNYLLNVVMITNMRMIDIEQSVFFKRERDVIYFQKIQDFRCRQTGILQRIFKYGDLIVLGASSDVHYTFHFIPRVNKVHHIMSDIQKSNIQFPHLEERARQYDIQYQIETQKHGHVH
ncbi:PH domain-containing protein [Candidatus Peregrinibacteria bacterium]|nr:MAG: PH domain-containing protein [Candidatus Peregrinibacteria bacterium]